MNDIISFFEKLGFSGCRKTGLNHFYMNMWLNEVEQIDAQATYENEKLLIGIRLIGRSQVDDYADYDSFDKDKISKKITDWKTNSW